MLPEFITNLCATQLNNHNCMHEKLIILDFGSQTTQLIGRRVRELNMYCEIVPYNKFPHDATDVKGVILSGSLIPYTTRMPLRLI